MNVYSRNNPAKQWVLEEIERISGGREIRICDLACGAGSMWPEFLRDHPTITYVGLDTDRTAIEKAKTAFAQIPNASVRVADGQTFRDGEGTFDVVTAFSALEHVVDVRKFIATAMSLLVPGGRALLNHDAGHFRSHDVKERIMVPVSQLLAKFGFEGPYMRAVSDEELRAHVAACGGKLLQLRKHNLHCFKKSVKGDASTEDVARTLLAFENRMNELLPTDVMDKMFWATILVIEKPRA